MKRFKYKAKDKDGRDYEGEVEAANEAAAIKLLRQRNLFVISLGPVRSLPFASLLKFRNKIGSGEITNFTRQLATMVNAGLPITESLLILRTQASGKMSKTVAQILADVEEGQSLSSAMERHRGVFSKTYIALIKSGETGGVLDEVLMRLSDNLEKQEEFRGKVKGALIYPAIIVIGMVAVGLVMVIFVIPKMTSLYEQFDAELPITTRILIGISDFMIKFWPLVVLGVGGLIWGFKVYRNTPAGKLRTDELFLKIPIAGDLQRQIILTEVSRTLSLMVGSGVSILEGLTITSGVVTNRVISDALTDAGKLVEKGFPVALSFSKHPEAFPFIFSQMVSVGEETGKMDEVLEKVSHVFEVESEQKVKALTAAIEPLILIVLGVGVAFLVISVILPIYNLTTQF